MKTPIQGQYHLSHFAERMGAELLSDKHHAKKSDNGLIKKSGQWWKHSVKVSFYNGGKLYLEKQLAQKSDNWPQKVTIGPKKWQLASKSDTELLERSW